MTKRAHVEKQERIIKGNNYKIRKHAFVLSREFTHTHAVPVTLERAHTLGLCRVTVMSPASELQMSQM